MSEENKEETETKEEQEVTEEEVEEVIEVSEAEIKARAVLEAYGIEVDLDKDDDFLYKKNDKGEYVPVYNIPQKEKKEEVKEQKTTERKRVSRKVETPAPAKTLDQIDPYKEPDLFAKTYNEMMKG